jgi:hypothetical protein
MQFFLFIWRWLCSPHCVCDCGEAMPICHHHEGDRKDGKCCFCKHGRDCHQLS